MIYLSTEPGENTIMKCWPHRLMSYFSGEQKEVNLIQNVLGVACVRPLPQKINGTYFFRRERKLQCCFPYCMLVGGVGGSFVFTLMVSKSNMQHTE